MNDLPIEVKKIENDILIDFLKCLKSKEKKYFLRNEILIFLEKYLQDKKLKPQKLFLYNFFQKIREIIFYNHSSIYLYRYKIAKYLFLNFKERKFEKIELKDYLNIRDYIITKKKYKTSLIDIDYVPFYDYSPMIKDSKEIGEGMKFLNKILATGLFNNPEKWNKVLFEFLKIHCINNIQLLIQPDKINTVEKLIKRIEYILELIETKKSKEYILKEMAEYGFAAGWGDTINTISKNLQLLLELLTNPNAEKLEKFISKIPMVSKIAIISIHGWFSQGNVLGKPDTGGQVVYIFDQVKYLEKVLSYRLKKAGLSIKPKIIILTRQILDKEDTDCDVAEQKINDTDNCYIVRIPFKDKQGRIIKNWISRFHIYKYLERYAYDAKNVLLEKFSGRPDLIIGNYTDGNLAASFLSKMLKVTQCNIAHALEKTKYLFSDLYWKDMEKDYNFSKQFTADMVAMNSASFIITSTYQEIAGTEDMIGQYESYQFFSMPGLYHVKGGINLFHPKFNVISPGANDKYFFPYYKLQLCNKKIKDELVNYIFKSEDKTTFGRLKDENKPFILLISRLDKIKNVTGALLSFAKNKELRKKANFIYIGGKLDCESTFDFEEKDQIKQMYKIIKEYDLYENIRWCARNMKRNEMGEIFRIIGDRKSIFLQPALFEAFGLTIIEAMTCGIVVFATKFGGPAEIINDGKNGFLINPTIEPDIADKILKFILKTEKDKNYWNKISDNAIKRVKEKYNWDLYANRLLDLANIYGFWKYSVSIKAKEKMNLYNDLIYDNFIRKRL